MPDRFALLTQRESGGRLLVRLSSVEGGWCSDPSVPAGEDLTTEPAKRRENLSQWRRTWLRARVYEAVNTEDLRSLISAIGTRPEEPPAPGDDSEQKWLLGVGLVEVWLAEHGFTGTEAQAVRTMVALRGLSALDAYAAAV